MTICRPMSNESGPVSKNVRNIFNCIFKYLFNDTMILRDAPYRKIIIFSFFYKPPANEHIFEKVFKNGIKNVFNFFLYGANFMR